MAIAQASIDTTASPDAVWEVVGDFAGIGEWMPGIDGVVIEEEDRILSTLGLEIRERLIARDDGTRVLTYSIIDGVPVDTHRGVVTVTPTETGSRVTWDVDVTPDEMVDLLAATYQQALDVLKTVVEA